MSKEVDSTAQETTNAVEENKQTTAEKLYQTTKEQTTEETVKDNTTQTEVESKAKEETQESTNQTDEKTSKGEEKANEKDETTEETRYELKLPENSQLKQEAVDSLVEYARANGLSQTQAQSLLEREAKQHEAFTQQSVEQLKQQSEVWVSELKDDDNFGGHNFDKNIAAAKLVVDKFGDDNLKQALNSTGLGNHPGLVKMLAQIGHQFTSGSLVTGKPAGNKKVSIAERLYGSSTG